jgi:predicted nucleotidyltransferase
MLQKDNKYRVLRVFFDDPVPEGIGFQLRELSRKTEIATPSVKKYLAELEKDRMIIKAIHRIPGYPVYYANRDNEEFRFLKKLDNMRTIFECGLLDYLSEACMPDAIILFGSASMGEDLKNSDIDIFVLSDEEKLNLSKFEKKLSRKINILFSKNFNKLSSELRNNILNGVILKGYLKVF